MAFSHPTKTNGLFSSNEEPNSPKTDGLFSSNQKTKSHPIKWPFLIQPKTKVLPHQMAFSHPTKNQSPTPSNGLFSSNQKPNDPKTDYLLSSNQNYKIPPNK
jgi:hypothetical protein